jgi:hypothetical protein
VGIRLAAASLYEKLQITYRAREEYKNALLLDPGNRVARAHLEKLDS